jgi:hypothetical protein
MIFTDRWADQWIDAWNRQDLDALLTTYADEVELRSPFSKVYASGGVVRGKAALRSYWGEVMRRIPDLRLERIAVYSGHMTLALHYRDSSGRNCIETVLFDEHDRVVMETACLDRLR